MRNKIIVGLSVVAIVIGSVATMSAFEAHIINVTATIENALRIEPLVIEFGTVFPQERLDRTFTVTLNDSFIGLNSGSNLIENGGFEIPEVTDSAKWDIFPDGTTGLGWTVEWESTGVSYGGQTRPATALLELSYLRSFINSSLN